MGKGRERKTNRLLNEGKAHLTTRHIKTQKIPQFIVGQCLDRDPKQRAQSATVSSEENLEVVEQGEEGGNAS